MTSCLERGLLARFRPCLARLNFGKQDVAFCSDCFRRFRPHSWAKFWKIAQAPPQALGLRPWKFL